LKDNVAHSITKLLYVECVRNVDYFYTMPTLKQFW